MTPEITRILKRLRLGRVYEGPSVNIVQCRIMEKTVRFCTDMENDPIQRNHRRGRFYEMAELRQIAEVFPKGGTFVDIGANVGNHSLFAALFFNAGRVIPFEPNAKAYRLLIQNVLANNLLSVFDLSKLGVGLSRDRQGGFGMEPRQRNLGAAKMLEGSGEIDVYAGDALLSDTKPDLIKIDVEGMEMPVLHGLAQAIKRNRPMLFVEVDNENETEFLAWAKSNKYTLVKTYQRYRLNKNHILVDTKKAAKFKNFGARVSEDA